MRYIFKMIVVALLVPCALVRSQTTKPTTAPAVSPEAQSLLDDLLQAYASVKSLDLAGTISLQFQAENESQNPSAAFAGAYRAPGQFRHEIKNDALVVSTGEKVFAFIPARNEYLNCDAPKTKENFKDLPASLVKLLGEQNPSLLLALSPDAGKQLIAGATKIARGPNVSVGTTAYPTLSFVRDLVAYQVLIDPKTHFLRQVRVDQKKLAEKRGRTDVSAAMLIIDYTKTTPGATFPDALFAWTPPKTATAMKTESEEPSEPGEAATALVGQPAPDFTLNGLDGKSVSLAELKGSVVVLDFWATWCGPCVASMPHLDKLFKEKSADGLKLYAIDLREEQAKVQKFLEAKQLGLPVLLDTKGETAKKYLVSGIPQTVVVGKDGVVKKVIVGFGGDESELRAAVEAAMQAQ